MRRINQYTSFKDMLIYYSTFSRHVLFIKLCTMLFKKEWVQKLENRCLCSDILTEILLRLYAFNMYHGQRRFSTASARKRSPKLSPSAKQIRSRALSLLNTPQVSILHYVTSMMQLRQKT